METTQYAWAGENIGHANHPLHALVGTTTQSTNTQTHYSHSMNAKTYQPVRMSHTCSPLSCQSSSINSHDPPVRGRFKTPLPASHLASRLSICLFLCVVVQESWLVEGSSGCSNVLDPTFQSLGPGHTPLPNPGRAKSSMWALVCKTHQHRHKHTRKHKEKHTQTHKHTQPHHIALVASQALVKRRQALMYKDSMNREESSDSSVHPPFPPDPIFLCVLV